MAAGRSLDGRVVVITGGDTGLGLETTKALATTNATVVIGAYNLTNGEQVAAAVRASSGNPDVSARHVDLSNFSSVREFAASVLADHHHPQQFRGTATGGTGGITTLINNAGMGEPLPSLPSVTADGFERVFQVNYLGPFLLSQRLLPALRDSEGGGRVITVASAASVAACSWGLRPDGCLGTGELLQLAATTQNGTLPPSPPPCGTLVGVDGNDDGDVLLPCNEEGTPASNYALTKFAQVAHAMELNAREEAQQRQQQQQQQQLENEGENEAPNRARSVGRSGGGGVAVRAFSLHPGFVDTPMTHDLSPATAEAWCKPLPLKPGVCPISAQAGAATQTYLAVADASELEHGVGQYFVNCKVRGWRVGGQTGVRAGVRAWSALGCARGD